MMDSFRERFRVLFRIVEDMEKGAVYERVASLWIDSDNYARILLVVNMAWLCFGVKNSKKSSIMLYG